MADQHRHLFATGICLGGLEGTRGGPDAAESRLDMASRLRGEPVPPFVSGARGSVSAALSQIR